MARRAIPFLIFLVLAGILLWPLAAGKVLLPASMLGHMAPWECGGDSGSREAHWNALTWDSIAYFYPARHLLGKALRSGELPLWNPHQMCGMPFLASPQSAVLYPPNWLFAVLPTDLTFGLLAFLHLFAAGSFTHLFLRKLGLGASASTFGGVAFMLSGWSITWLHLPVFLGSGIWLPLTLYLVTVSWERRSALHAALAGATIALSLFGGHPQIGAYLLMATALYWIYLAVTDRKSVVRAVGLALVTFAVGFTLAAPQLLPTMELASLSHRGGSVPTIEGYRAYNSLAMPARALIGCLMPDFFGNPTKGSFWGSGEYAEFSGYVGLLPLLLLPFAFVGWGRRNAAFFAFIAVLALLMATGTGVNRLPYFGVPGFSNSGSPARVLYLYTFAVVVLGSIGLDRLLALGRHHIGICLGSAAGLTAVGAALFLVNAEFVGEITDISALDLLASIYWPLLTALAFLMVGAVGMMLARHSPQVAGAVLIGLLAVDLLVFGSGYNHFSSRREVYPVVKEIERLKACDLGRVAPLNDQWRLRSFPKAVLPPNAATVYGLFDVQGYDSLYPVRYKRLLDAAAGRDSAPPENGNMVFARNPDSPIWDLLGVRYFISRATEGRALLSNKPTFRRAFVVHKTRRASDEEMLRLLTSGDFEPSTVALVGNDLHLDGNGVGAHAEITDYGLNAVVVEVHGAELPGLLVLPDQYYPGWTARVNGKPMPVHEVDYCLRGVEVPKGRSTVRFSFEPQSFRNGLYLAGLGGLLLLGLAAHDFRRRGGRP